MKLRDLITSTTLAAGLFLTGCSAPPQGWRADQLAKHYNDTIPAPEPTMQLDTPPQPSIDTIQLPTSARANYAFHNEQHTIKDALPHAVRLWRNVFNATEDNVLFFALDSTDTKQAGETLATLPKHEQWTRETLQEAFAGSGIENNVNTINAQAYPWNARELEDIIEAQTPHDITYNSGRQEAINDDIAPFITTFKHAYEAHNLAPNAASQLLAESGGNPLAQSWAALGIGQLHEDNYRTFRRAIPDYPHWADAIGQADVTAGLMEFAKKFTGSHFGAATFYHAGITNLERVMRLGMTDDTTPIEAYAQGLRQAQKHRKNTCFNQYNGTLGKATRNYAATIIALEDTMQTMETKTAQADLKRVEADQYWTASDLAEATDTTTTAIINANPHLQFGPMHLLNIYDDATIPGKEITPWKQEQTRLDREYEQWQPRLDWDTVEEARAFSRKFTQQGDVSRAAATLWGANAIAQRLNGTIRGVPISHHINRLERCVDDKLYKSGGTSTR